MPARMTAFMSMPAALIDSTSSNLWPCSRSITRTRFVTSVGMRTRDRRSTAGPSPRGRSRCRACSALRGGSRAPRRSCRRTARRSPAGSRARRPGCVRSSFGEIHDIALQVEPDELVDLRTLHLDDDLFAGLRACARCTCAIDAAAIGFVANSEKTAPSGLPRSVFDDAPHVVERLRGDLVPAQPELRDELLREDRLRPRDRICPSLMYVGPSRLEGLAQALGDARSARAVALCAGRSAASRRSPFRARPPGAQDPSDGRQLRGPSERVGLELRLARSSSMPVRHDILSGSTTHGPCSVNEKCSKSGATSVRSTRPARYQLRYIAKSGAWTWGSAASGAPRRLRFASRRSHNGPEESGPSRAAQRRCAVAPLQPPLPWLLAVGFALRLSPSALRASAARRSRRRRCASSDPLYAVRRIRRSLPKSLSLPERMIVSPSPRC